jgi:2-keto-3-deoxy-L-rhamnonate aldolase RhmA
MLIDCEGCTVRGAACGGCVVTLFLDTPAPIHSIGAAEADAIEVLALAGFEVTVIDPTHVERSHDIPFPSRRWSAA